MPASMVVIGSSFVALELAQAYRRLSTEVTILARATLLTRDDPDIGAGLQAALEAEGIKVLTNTNAQAVSHRANRFTVTLKGGAEDGSIIVAEQLLIAVGRRPNTDDLALDRAGVDTDLTGAIIVDDHMRTAVEHIYAAGDCSTMPQLVYVAAAAGTRAAINMTGGDATLDLSIVPAVVFTEPSVATVGLDDAQARAAGIKTIIRRLDLENIPRALANFDTTGFVKPVVDSATGRLLGTHAVGSEVTELLPEMVMAAWSGVRADQFEALVHAHPTLSEALKEAALAADGQAIHI
jgi:mercuric reductase